MSEISIPMTLSLDNDGFLRRECPNCERQFKWWSTPSEGCESQGATQAVPETYFCPYCYQPADPNAWWTKEQLEYAQRLAATEVLKPQLERFQRDMKRRSRRSKNIRIEASSQPLPKPESLTENDDMVRVDVPCHPEEPIKVEEGWEREVACLVCGIHYPAELVRAMPESKNE
jgi:hypothetical protein